MLRDLGHETDSERAALVHQRDRPCRLQFAGQDDEAGLEKVHYPDTRNLQCDNASKEKL